MKKIRIVSWYFLCFSVICGQEKTSTVSHAYVNEIQSLTQNIKPEQAAVQLLGLHTDCINATKQFLLRTMERDKKLNLEINEAYVARIYADMMRFMGDYTLEKSLHMSIMHHALPLEVRKTLNDQLAVYAQKDFLGMSRLLARCAKPGFENAEDQPSLFGYFFDVVGNYLNGMVTTIQSVLSNFFPSFISPPQPEPIVPEPVHTEILPVIVPVPCIETEVELVTETCVATETETEIVTEATVERESETETETRVETETEAESEMEVEVETESEVEAETESESETESEAETEVGTESETETETELETEIETEVETETENENESETETEVCKEDQAHDIWDFYVPQVQTNVIILKSRQRKR